MEGARGGVPSSAWGMRKGCLEEVRPESSLGQELANGLSGERAVWGYRWWEQSARRARRTKIAATVDVRWRVAAWKRSPDFEGS